ncbi:hypothetical protein D1AOALGA4SA_4271 [Olavius algarvensis Delta 1 endosymbiont]|nr:hypothetical protein D1AOALGA4SA_4271 [Olavius algarvensis Delta 1 endosymbiont]
MVMSSSLNSIFGVKILKTWNKPIGRSELDIIIFNIEPAHKLKIDQNKLQNCRSNILNLVNVL